MCVIAQGEQGWISTKRCGRLLRNSGENDKNSVKDDLSTCEFALEQANPNFTFLDASMIKDPNLDQPVPVLVSLVTLDKAPEDVAS